MLNTNMINSENENYVDLSTAVAFEATNTSGCITIVETNNSTRLKISKSLHSDLGNPGKLKVLLTKSNVIFLAGDDDVNALEIKKDNTIYNTVLAKKVMEISGAEFNGGSTKIGTYHLQQQADGEPIAAVVSF